MLNGRGSSDACDRRGSCGVVAIMLRVKEGKENSPLRFCLSKTVEVGSSSDTHDVVDCDSR
jgi:hypothetical protein